MKYLFAFAIGWAFLACMPLYAQEVNTSTLLDELTDLKRLPDLDGPDYTVLNFSSYDRQSGGKYKDQRGWYDNSDGFGNEAIPNFEGVIEAADEEGKGKYLICDVEGPGAVVREWSAMINGRVSVSIDGKELYEGPANHFFRHTYDAIAGIPEGESSYENTFSQSFSGYYPIPFAKRLRIEWSGNLKELHFYILQVRKYETGTKISSFTLGDIAACSEQMQQAMELLANPDKLPLSEGVRTMDIAGITVPEKTKRVKVMQVDGGGAIQEFSIKVKAGDLASALRQNILRIAFDDYVWGQVQAPLGDFFTTAMGIDPMNSLPFTVGKDSVLTCRFVMPFKKSATLWIDNLSDQDIEVNGSVKVAPYKWSDDRSMYFHTSWRIDHDITAEEYAPVDLVVLMARGKGRYVGTSVFLKNPASGPNNWGNWWGEGDEKIYIDDDKYPTLFGTGTEDYFGYAWSSSDLFDYAYLGQPRNDGPGNRGFVTNYRFHIIDDLVFQDHIAFFMELFSHDSIPDFTYGRMAYYYALDGSYDDHELITEDDVRIPVMPLTWEPKKLKGSKGFEFYEAEKVLVKGDHTGMEENLLWSGGTSLVWRPEKQGEKLGLELPAVADGEELEIRLTVKKSPEGGKISMKLNGEKVAGGAIYDLHEDYHTVSRIIYLPKVNNSKKQNRLELFFEGNEGQQVGLDFIWVRSSELQ
ncbi:MAG: glycoside hydrolase family 172 protein [Bacteroidota bacterium]